MTGPSDERHPILLNARAAVRASISGVERWAIEVISRLEQLDPKRYLVVSPPSPLRTKRGGQVWEQSLLPLEAARLHASLIFSPANLSPRLWPRNVVVVHDASMLRDEGTFTRGYKAWHAKFGIAGAQRALAVITVSEFSRRELIELAGLESDRVVIIHGGVDRRFTPTADHERAARALGLKRPYVLTVGTDDRRKNLPALAVAARRLGELGIDLVWAGGTRSYITSGDSADGLRAVGYVDDSHLPGLYAGARAFVLPSRYEGFGLPCIEAMACGTPVVAANRAALPETCGPAALLVDPDDPDDVANGVIRAVTDRAVAQQLSRAGIERSAQMTWDRTAAQVNSLLLGLASR